MVVEGHRLGLEDDPKRPGPGSGGVFHIMVRPGTGRRRPVETAGMFLAHRLVSAVGLEKRFGQRRAHAVAGPSDEDIGVPVGQCQRHRLRMGERGIAAPHAVGLGPGGAQTRQHPFQAHGVFGIGRALARTPGGGDALK